MSLKAKVEAIIYAAEDPVTLEQMSLLLKDVVLADLASARENLAIEQADSAAEAAAEAGPSASEAKAEESELLPELALNSAELICPEPGPLMPEEAPSSDKAQTESSENKTTEDAPEETQAKDAEQAVIPVASAAGTSEPDSETTDVSQPALGTGPNTEALAAEEAAPATGEPAPAESAAVTAPETAARKRQPKKTEKEIADDKAVRARVREVLVELVADYANEDRGMEIRQVAGGFRMATKPEHHDVVRAFAKSLKPPIRLSLAALETLAVVAYKQPVTGPEIADIRGVESASVLGTLLDRKLITTAGRKQVIGRPMQYKTSKDFLLRFGLNDVNELPSMEEFSQLASDGTIEIAPAEQETLSLFEPEAQSPNAVEITEDVLVVVAQDTTPETENTASQVAESPAVESAEKENLANDQEPSLPQPQESANSQQSDAADATGSPSQSDDETSNVPKAEHPVGQ